MSNFLLKGGHTPVVHIHIPKTGGSTIRLSVFPGKEGYEGPVYGEIPGPWRRYWSFAFVRHPMRRWWSAYRDFKHIRKYEGTPDQFAEETLSRKNTEKWGSIAHHTEPQTSPSLCLKDADDVFYYSPDEYREAVETVCSRAGRPLPARLERLRQTPPTKEEGLSAAVERRLHEFYAQDFEELGYAP